METNLNTINRKIEDHHSSLTYQTPIIIKLDICQLVQSATQIMNESNGGYYS